MPKLTPYMQKKIAKQKSELLTELSVTPIVTFACKKCGFSRATYYRWVESDHEFKMQAQMAQEKGADLINDIAESNVINGIKDGDSGYTRFWLSHRHPKFNVVRKLAIPSWDDIMKHFAPPDWLFKPFMNND